MVIWHFWRTFLNQFWLNLVHKYNIHFCISFVLYVVLKCQYFWVIPEKLISGVPHRSVGIFRIALPILWMPRTELKLQHIEFELLPKTIHKIRHTTTEEMWGYWVKRTKSRVFTSLSYGFFIEACPWAENFWLFYLLSWYFLRYWYLIYWYIFVIQIRHIT